MTSMRASSGVSYVHGASDTPLIGETISSCVARQVAAHGDQDAIVSCHQQLRYSYRTFDREVRRAARGLLALGVEKGDRVGIWSANCVEWVVTQYAAAAVGAILMSLSTVIVAFNAQLLRRLRLSTVQTVSNSKGSSSGPRL